MALPLDNLTTLTQRWRANPNAQTTSALCDALRAAPRPALVDEVAELVARAHGQDASVLTAAARMFMSVARLADAQAVLVNAGRVAPRDARVYACLGEVLLRRGDAERASKVFERARALGDRSEETRAWSERAKQLVPVQHASGMHTVAHEVAANRRSDTDLQTDPAYEDDLDAAAEQGSYPDAEPTRAFTGRGAILRAGGAAARAGRSLPPISAPPPVSPRPRVSVPPALPRSERAPVPPGSDLWMPASSRRPAPDSFPKAAFVAPPAPAFADAPSPWAAAPPPPFAPPVSGLPDAEAVLQALSHAGVFTGNDHGADPVRWDAAGRRARGRGPVVLAAAIVLLVAGALGIFHQVQSRRAEDQQRAQALVHEVDALLDDSAPKDLAVVEAKLSEVFELDSRSREGALVWVRERALAGLLRGGSELAFEGAMTRAADVKVPDADVAFARVASFLFQGDTVGAAALLPKWDSAAANDPWYQLVSGVALERAGDRRANERYQAAVRLDPKLVIAKVALARSEALEGEPEKANRDARALETEFPGRAEPAALVTLAYLRDPNHQGAEPPEAAATLAKGGELPAPLAVVPFAVSATRAVTGGDFAGMSDAIKKGLAVSDSPGVASWLGAIALSANNEELARRAALVAVSFSAVYPPARMLAARVALLGGRLEEALKATEELDASVTEVAVVRAAVAYERLDADALARASEGLPPDARKHPLLAALAAAPSILAGRAALSPDKLLALARSSAPWSDLLAMDAALDAGDLPSATAIAGPWGDAEGRPLRAARLARLARFQALAALTVAPGGSGSAPTGGPATSPNGLIELADVRSKAALDAASVTPRALVERVLVASMRGRGASDGSAVLAKYPLVLGPQTVWLGAYLSASAGRVEEARARVASIDLPPPLAPLVARTLAAQALSAMKDRRRGVPAVRALLDAGVKSLDVANAALGLGFRPVGGPGRRGSWISP